MRTRIIKPVSLEELPDFCSLEEFAGVLRISRSTAYRMAARGNIPALRIGRRVILSKEHLRRWVDESVCYKYGGETSGKA